MGSAAGILVQTQHNLVHGGGAVALVSAHRQRLDTRRGPWATRRFGEWALDWGGEEGHDARVRLPAGGILEYRREPRTWALHAPGVIYHERYHLQRGREFLYLFFTIRGELPPLSTRALTLVRDRDDRLAARVRALIEARAQGGIAGELAAHALFLALIADLASATGRDDHLSVWRLPGEAARPRLLAEVDAVMERSLRDPPSRARIAAALGMSESALAHRFRSETGMTLPERCAWLRVREAKARLADPSATVKGVARGLGFSSASHFARTFARCEGISPSGYLRRARR